MDIPKEIDFISENYYRYIKTISLKDFLVYDNEFIKKRYVGHLNRIKRLKDITIDEIVKEFLGNSMFYQRGE